MNQFSVWHWVVVLGFVGCLIFAVTRFRRPKAVATSDGAIVAVAQAEPNGLGGWLALLALGQIAAICRLLLAVIENIDAFKTPNLSSAGEMALGLDVALNVVMFGLVVLTTVAMFRKLHSFPSLWMWQGMAALLIPHLGAVLVARILNVRIAEVLEEKWIGQLVGSAIIIGLWIWYLKVSVRVRNTFVN